MPTLAARLDRAERRVEAGGWWDARPVDPEAPPPDTLLEWSTRYRRLEGHDFSLARFAPLQALYEESHPHVVLMKAAQRGASEWALGLAMFTLEHGARLWAPDKGGLNVMYVFPTQQALGDFSKERLSGMKQESPHLASLFGSGDFDAVQFKQIGSSYLYLRGGWSESALLSLSADVLILDEFDRLDPKAIALARRRMNASTVRREVDISTPTIPGKGIHALYLQSDQRMYEQPCPGCGGWRVWDFLEHVRADGEPHAVWRTWSAERIRRADVALTCPECGHALTRDERCAAGRWVARAPEVEGIRGYHLPSLAFPFVLLDQLAVAAVSADPSEVQEFYRSDLGQPYEVHGSRVTDEMLGKLSAHLPNGQLPAVARWRDATMGVDVGARFHYRVSALDPEGRVVVLAMGAATSWEDLDLLMAAHQVRQCVIDALPELHACQAWAARFPGRVLRALYPTPAALAGQAHRVDEDRGIVQVNRTMAMDGVYAAIAAGAEHWPAAIHNDPDVRTQMTAPVRVVTTDERGQERASWVHTAPDHLFHAALYDRTARAVLPAAVPVVGPMGHAELERENPYEGR